MSVVEVCKCNFEVMCNLIFDVVEVFFVVKGFVLVLLSDIVCCVLVIKSLIYYYFGFKEVLWDQCKKWCMSYYVDVQ